MTFKKEFPSLENENYEIGLLRTERHAGEPAELFFNSHNKHIKMNLYDFKKCFLDKANVNKAFEPLDKLFKSGRVPTRDDVAECHKQFMELGLFAGEEASIYGKSPLQNPEILRIVQGLMEFEKNILLFHKGNKELMKQMKELIS